MHDISQLTKLTQIIDDGWIEIFQGLVETRKLNENIQKSYALNGSTQIRQETIGRLFRIVKDHYELYMTETNNALFEIKCLCDDIRSITRTAGKLTKAKEGKK